MVAGAVLLTGCGSGAAAASASAPLRSAASSSTLTVALPTAPATLDPQANPLLANRLTWALSYQCLLDTTNSGAIVPELATSYSVSKNKLHYVFNLRHGVKFQNGDVFTSADVVYTFRRLFKTGSPTIQAVFTNYKSVVALGLYRVEFNLSAPNAGFAASMASPEVFGCAILNEQAGRSGRLSTHMVGTGPWEQVSYSPDASITLRRFTGYWGAKTAAAKLVVLYVPVSSTQVTDLEAHKVDLIVSTEPAIASLKGVRGVKTTAVSSDTVVALQLNAHVKPFNNVNVRRAVALAVDRSALATVAYSKGATPSGPVPPSYGWTTPLSKLPYASYNPGEARKLLRKAGYPHGVSVTLKYITGYDWGTNALTEQVASELGEVGIHVTLVPLDTTAWLQEEITKDNYQIGWNEYASYSNPYTYVQIQSNRIGPGKGNIPPALAKLQDEALDASPSGFDGAINRIVHWQFEYAYPNVNLIALDTFAAYLNNVTNVHVQSSGSTQYLASVKVG